MISDMTDILAWFVSDIVIVCHPVNVCVPVNHKVTLSVRAEGSGILNYQWFTDDKKEVCSFYFTKLKESLLKPLKHPSQAFEIKLLIFTVYSVWEVCVVVFIQSIHRLAVILSTYLFLLLFFSCVVALKQTWPSKLKKLSSMCAEWMTIFVTACSVTGWKWRCWTLINQVCIVLYSILICIVVVWGNLCGFGTFATVGND